MSAELIYRYGPQVASTDGNLRYRFENTVASPIVSVTDRLDMVARAGQYRITGLGATSVSIGVESEGGSARHPYHNPTGVTVVADGVTKNWNVVPGFGIAFANTLAVGQEALFTVEDYLASDATVTEVFDPGIVDAAGATTPVQLAVLNAGDQPSGLSKMIALPGTAPETLADAALATTWFARLTNHLSASHEKEGASGYYDVTFLNWQTDPGGSGKKVADMYIAKDGGAAVLAASQAKFDGETPQQYGESNWNDAGNPCPGVCIVLADTTADPSAITIRIRVDGQAYTWCYYAPEVSAGVPGTYVNAEVDLTKSGESTGVITVGGAAYAWSKYVVPSSVSPSIARIVNHRLRWRTI